MAVKIRLARKGSHKNPFYRIVVIDSRKARGSSYLDCVGTYNPQTDPAAVTIDKAKADEWLQKGAQPTQTVRQLLAKAAQLQ
ncbi:MAG: 30S ribosomal protein S16 [Candidatus Schekmanbacteria bacterium]|nr:30S ribosomal protein S16 [Candidatus Schekmanbacteria bacterium]